MEAVDILDEACEEEVRFDWLVCSLMILNHSSTVVSSCIDYSATGFTAPR